MPPFIAINTTAGTASEMTRFTIITDTDRHVKMAIADWHVTANVSINDPELMLSMPILAENAMKDTCGLTNPRKATEKEIIQIYKNAM